MPRPAMMPPKRLMKLGWGGGVTGAGGVAAGAAALAGAGGAEFGACFIAGDELCLPRLLPPPKRRAASASQLAAPRASAGGRVPDRGLVNAPSPGAARRN